MGEYKLISITNSSKPNKKLMAKFKNKKTGRESVTHFGARGMDDYTKTKDKAQRERYRNRHKGDNLTNARSPGALSWYVLWGNSTSKRDNIASYKRRFGL
tara:strand:+ start:824 stop:1123 length:300 start_codon:yes stop_codon:yes gene_type:complete